MDKQKYQYEGMKWLFELELLNHPQVINTLKFNILVVSKRIKEVELLIYREHKSMLILVDLTWIGQKFFKKQIFTEIHESLSQLLPSFRFRVTDDPKIMEMAVEKVKKALTGGKHENATDTKPSVPSPAVEQKDDPDIIAAAALAAANDTSLETSSQEPPKSGEVIRPTTSSSDSKTE